MSNRTFYFLFLLCFGAFCPAFSASAEPTIEVWDDPHAVIGAIARTVFAPYPCKDSLGADVSVRLPSLWRASDRGDGRIVFQSSCHAGVMAVLKRIGMPAQTDGEDKAAIAQWAQSQTIALTGEISPLPGPLNDAARRRRAYAFSGRASGETWRYAAVFAPLGQETLFFVFQVPDAWFNAYMPIIETMGQI